MSESRVEAHVLLVQRERKAAPWMSRLAECAEVTVVSDAKEALACLREADFDLMFSDVELPEIDGFELVRQVRARHPLMAIALLSDNWRIDLALRALRVKADDFLLRASPPAMVMATVEKLIGPKLLRSWRPRNSQLNMPTLER